MNIDIRKSIINNFKEVNDIIHVNGHVEKRYNDYQIVVKKIEKID